MSSPEEAFEPPRRRAFLVKSLAVLIGGVISAFPFAAGIAMFLDPLRRKTAGAANFVPVASLSALPEDGMPVKFPVITSRVDVWTTSALTPVGAVYLRRTGPKAVKAFNVVCPHAGCFVDFVPDRKSYLCPCHDSTFGLDGNINDPRSPSPRGLDELEVEVRNESEVWVRFQNYRAGVHQKIPLACRPDAGAPRVA